MPSSQLFNKSYNKYMPIHTFINTYHIFPEHFPLISFVMREPIQDLLARKASLTKEEQTKIFVYIKQAINSMPLAYITNETYFFTEKFFVTNDVLIPRSETEYLVESAISYCKVSTIPLTICDMCTGSGCIGICITKYVSSDHHVYLSDLSPKALEVCRINVQSLLKNDHTITLLQSDLFKNYPAAADWKINVLIANPPYIPSSRIATLDASVKEYEPHLALDGGIDGADLIQAILEQSVAYMAKDFLILMEIDAEHAKKVQKIAISLYPHASVCIKKDLFGKNRYLQIQSI